MIMASKRLNTEKIWTGRRIDFPDFRDALSKRRAELDNPDLPRNTGERRTESKKALLNAIKEAGGKW